MTSNRYGAQCSTVHRDFLADHSRSMATAVTSPPPMHRQATPRCIVLTHGDQPARDWFAAELAKLAPKTKVVDPIPGKEYTL